MKISSRYEPIAKLGKGSRGEVILAKNKIPDDLVAIKIIPVNKLSKNDDPGNLRDYVIPRLLNCQKNVACVYDSFREGDNVYIVSKYYKKSKDLSQLKIPDLKAKINQRLIVDLMLIISQALRDIHEVGVAHRDIKPENILYQTIKTKDNQISYLPIIIDFDLACVVKKVIKDKADLSKAFPCNKIAGTPIYIAPEVWLQEYSDLRLADIYSLGAVFYQLVSDFKEPYEYPDSFKRDDYVDHVLSEPALPAKTELKVLNQLIDSMLNKNPNDRPSMNEIVETLEKILDEINEDIKLNK